MPGGRRSTSPPASAAVAERSAATRAAIVDAARQLFVEQGYFATGTEEIVAAAGVGTRGALYHHFPNKRAVFLAVFEAVEEDLLSGGGGAMPDLPPLELLRRGLLAFLDASTSPEVQRIVLIDGPAVLGWDEWRAIESRYGLGALRSLLDLAVADGSLPHQPVDALAHVLLAAVDEAALFTANAPDPERARAEAVPALDRLLRGLFDGD